MHRVSILIGSIQEKAYLKLGFHYTKYLHHSCQFSPIQNNDGRGLCNLYVRRCNSYIRVCDSMCKWCVYGVMWTSCEIDQNSTFFFLYKRLCYFASTQPTMNLYSCWAHSCVREAYVLVCALKILFCSHIFRFLLLFICSIMSHLPAIGRTDLATFFSSFLLFFTF